MLPGFRFLFAAIILSMSVLIFGLGAAALFRSAHEEFASLPSRRPPAEPVFTRQIEPPMPTLALLRFDPPALGNRPPEDVAAASETATPAEQAPDPTPAEPEKLAAGEEPNRDAVAKAEIPVDDTTAEMPVDGATSIANEDVKVAAVVETPEPATTAVAPAVETPSLEDNIAAKKIATLGGPTVIIDEKIAANSDARPDRSVIRKRNAQRARERRRIAARRARLAALQAAAAAAQLQANPFGQLPPVRATR
jgi:hypothetical protein